VAFIAQCEAGLGVSPAALARMQTAMSIMFWARILARTDHTDVENFNRTLDVTLASRALLIGDEDVADFLRCVVDIGEEEGLVFLP
jgi:hypothetical protein